jgi:Zn finger protein HypA/HybF involved in hydrogenase expression
MNKTYTDEQFVDVVKESRTYMEVMKNLKLRTFGANYKTIYKNVKRLKLDTSHFLGKKEILAKARENRKKMSNEELFSINTIARKHVKNNVIQQNLIPYQCEKCGITEWQGEKLSLHLDHKNGNNQDNRLENLRFLCPNCHSLTPSYCGRNIRLKNPNPHVPGNCERCGKTILWSSKVCKQCQHFTNPACKPKIEWAPVIELIQFIKDSGSFVAAARKLGVSDNAVRKHLRRNNVDPKSVFART